MMTFQQIEKLSQDLNYKDEKIYYDKICKLINSDQISISIANAMRDEFNGYIIFAERYNKNIDYEKIFCTSYYGDDISIIDQLKNKFPEPDFKVHYGHYYWTSNYKIVIRWKKHNDCAIL